MKNLNVAANRNKTIGGYSLLVFIVSLVATCCFSLPIASSHSLSVFLIEVVCLSVIPAMLGVLVLYLFNSLIPEACRGWKKRRSWDERTNAPIFGQPLVMVYVHLITLFLAGALYALAVMLEGEAKVLVLVASIDVLFAQVLSLFIWYLRLNKESGMLDRH